MMEKSFLYALHSHKLKPGVTVDPTKFEPVYRSKYGKVRIYKILGVSRESKKWVEENRECDAGGWFCPGKYPPGLRDILKQKTDFAQLEDFNRGVSDEDYQKEYFENLNNPQLAKQRAAAKQVPAKAVPSIKPKTSSDTKKGTVQYYLDNFGVKQLINGNDEENAAMGITYAQMEEYLKEWISKYENQESFKEKW